MPTDTDNTEQDQKKQQLQLFGARLFDRIDELVRKRDTIEQRWVEDLRQINGVNDPTEDEALRKANKSRVFVNITRPKTATGEAQLADLLCPNDDRNFHIRPTPVPELQEAVGSKEDVMLDPQTVTTQGDVAKSTISEAKKKAEAMEREIDDQLTESDYLSLVRDCLHDACVLGTGVLKGPVVVARDKRTWTQGALSIEYDYRPAVERIDPWDFYPDMSARSMKEAEFVFERRRMSKGDLRKLSKRPGYLVEQIAQLVKGDPKRSSAINRQQEVRGITGVDQADDRENRYEVWEYTGPVDRDDLIAAGVEVSDDPLEELQAIVHFCDGLVIKAVLHPQSTGELPYSVFCWGYDDYSIFGFGIPRQMRGAQKVANAAWRMLMDNAALSMGPQIVVNQKAITPADGNWTMYARKVWLSQDASVPLGNVFAFHEVSSHQSELTDIFMRARQLGDEETNLPLISQGEQTANMTQTAQGMELLRQGASTVLRKGVKAFDDDVTRPLIGRFYDYNMEFSEKEEIKGDFQIDAVGSSYLFEKSQRIQGLIQLANLAGSPVFGPLTKHYELYKEIVRHQQLDPDVLVISQEELEAMQAQQQEGDSGADLQLKQKQLEQELTLAREKMALDRELGMMLLASKENLTLSALREKLGFEREKETGKRQIEGVKALNDQNELAFKAQTGLPGI